MNSSIFRLFPHLLWDFSLQCANAQKRYIMRLTRNCCCFESDYRTQHLSHHLFGFLPGMHLIQEGALIKLIWINFKVAEVTKEEGLIGRISHKRLRCHPTGFPAVLWDCLYCFGTQCHALVCTLYFAWWRMDPENQPWAIYWLCRSVDDLPLTLIVHQ